MSKKLALVWLLALTTPALAQNLVDRTENSSSGSILNLFGAVRNPFGGSGGEAKDKGCEPQINAAGNAVYVQREGCPLR